MFIQLKQTAGASRENYFINRNKPCIPPTGNYASLPLIKSQARDKNFLGWKKKLHTSPVGKKIYIPLYPTEKV